MLTDDEDTDSEDSYEMADTADITLPETTTANQGSASTDDIPPMPTRQGLLLKMDTATARRQVRIQEQGYQEFLVLQEFWRGCYKSFCQKYF